VPSTSSVSGSVSSAGSPRISPKRRGRVSVPRGELPPGSEAQRLRPPGHVVRSGHGETSGGVGVCDGAIVLAVPVRAAGHPDGPNRSVRLPCLGVRILRRAPARLVCAYMACNIIGLVRPTGYVHDPITTGTSLRHVLPRAGLIDINGHHSPHSPTQRNTLIPPTHRDHIVR
jgi:hypothetical protein